jgi:zinc protease
VEFFQKYYAPNNASLVIAGDIDAERARALAEKWFGAIPRRDLVLPFEAPQAVLTRVERQTLRDRVQLPRLYLGWVTPAQYQPGDAALDVVSQLLAGGKNSRLYRRLVYETQTAQDVSAFQASSLESSAYLIVVTPRLDRPGRASVTPQAAIDEAHRTIDEELDKLRQQPPDDRELQRALNQLEASFFSSLEAVGGFGGKADRLNAYFFATGNPDFFNEDLARYRALSANDIQAAVRAWLPKDRRVELTVLPEEK